MKPRRNTDAQKRKNEKVRQWREPEFIDTARFNAVMDRWLKTRGLSTGICRYSI